ncbi:MAG: hypothetical protein ABUS79_06535 [Pseudomonadota bacterium]
MMRAAAPVAVAMAVAAAAGCGAPARQATPPPTATPEPFIAFERDLQAFRDWESIDLPRGGAQGITHVAGVRREYLNRRPPAGATRFPVGTIFIKELREGADAGHQLFAMVKRGAGYNRDGATGWEWFELRPRTDGSLGIVWRGINAPVGEEYGGDPAGGCNSCHGMSAANDFVKSPVVKLRPRPAG